MFPFSDLALSRRLERAEGVSNARYVDARARLDPGRGAAWTEIAGALAMFDGVESPLTQTFCLGLFEPATDDVLDAVEAFFSERGAPSMHEVSPLADGDTIARLGARGYRPFELSSVLYRPIDPSVALAGRVEGSRVRTRKAERADAEQWARVAADGWRDFEGLGDFMLDAGRMSAEAGTHLFFAELDGRPIATGGLNVVDGIALLAGASTVPEGRRQGAQLALLETRLRWAAAAGCDVAMMAALPGSGSQRNAERHGFRIAYTRIKWRRF